MSGDFHDTLRFAGDTLEFEAVYDLSTSSNTACQNIQHTQTQLFERVNGE